MAMFLERLWQDLHHGCRMLAKNPAFTVVAVISLAMGIGVNCAMYSWADALLLRPLPVSRPGDVVTVGTKVSLAGFSNIVNSYPDFRDLRDHNRSFDNLTAFTGVTVGFTTKPDELPQMKFGVLTGFPIENGPGSPRHPVREPGPHRAGRSAPVLAPLPSLLTGCPLPSDGKYG